MINKPEHISLAHIKDLADGLQRNISDFVELDAGEAALSASRVLKALKHKQKGGEKI